MMTRSRRPRAATMDPGEVWMLVIRWLSCRVRAMKTAPGGLWPGPAIRRPSSRKSRRRRHRPANAAEVPLGRKLDKCLGELRGVTALLAVHFLPGGDCLARRLRVVSDRRLRPLRRLVREQLGAEKSGFHEHRADAEWRDLGRQRLHPAFDSELRRRVGRDERLPGYSAGRGDRHDQPAALSTQDRERGTRNIHRTEQVRFDLRPEILGEISSKNPA